MFIRVYINGTAVLEKSIYKSVITIGRNNDADVPIKLPEISGDHLNIIVSEDRILLTDKSSLNGSFLNNKRMKAMTNYEYISGTPIHLARSVALEILGSSDEAGESKIQAYPDEKAEATSTEKLGLDFTSIRNMDRLKKDLKHVAARPVRSRPSKPEVEEKSYLMPIIAVVIVAAVYFIFFKQ